MVYLTLSDTRPTIHPAAHLKLDIFDTTNRPEMQQQPGLDSLWLLPCEITSPKSTEPPLQALWAQGSAWFASQLLFDLSHATVSWLFVSLPLLAPTLKATYVCSQILLTFLPTNQLHPEGSRRRPNQSASLHHITFSHIFQPANTA